MGTRADFYTGRGKSAKYLGSIAWDGYPSGISSELLMSRTAEDYGRNLAGFSLTKEDWSTPEKNGWPWPWDNSNTTDYAYAFEDGQVWISNFGRPWFKASDIPRDKDGKFIDGKPYWNWEEKNIPQAKFDDQGNRLDKGQDFPNMKKIQRVTFGPRSGTMILGVTEKGLRPLEPGEMPEERLDVPGSKVEIKGTAGTKPGEIEGMGNVPVKKYRKRGKK